MVCPFGCVCHAVRAPGVKRTLFALKRNGPVGVAIGSMYTAPVNHSRGPAVVSMVFLVIRIADLPESPVAVQMMWQEDFCSRLRTRAKAVLAIRARVAALGRVTRPRARRPAPGYP